MVQTMMACYIADFEYLLGSENWKISAIEEEEGSARAQTQENPEKDSSPFKKLNFQFFLCRVLI